jgi:hypothetical protein
MNAQGKIARAHAVSPQAESEIQTAAELPVKRIPRRRSVASRLAAGVESTI